jgi:hypothetical protein
MLQKYNPITGKEYYGLALQEDLDPSINLGGSFSLPNTFFVSGNFASTTEKNKLTINQALQECQPGDNIIILPGIYTENIEISMNVNLIFSKGSKVINNTDDIIRISSDCAIYGEGTFENTGTNESFYTIKIINNADVIIKGNQIIDEYGGGVLCESNSKASLYFEKIYSRLVFIESSIVYIHSNEIYDLSVSNNAKVTIICKAFRMAVISGGKTIIDFKTNFQINGTIAPDGINVRIYGGYLELFGGTLQNTLNAGYPVEIINGKLKLSHMKIDELDYTLPCINALGGIIIVDNVVLVTGATYSINSGAGTILKNYIGTVSNKSISPNFIYGNNYLINLLTINSQVE